jgi:parvulin-like peptidyl-prolyl isomerase
LPYPGGSGILRGRMSTAFLKRWLPAGLAAMIVLPVGARGAEIVDGVAAIVNDKVITYSDVRDQVRAVLPQLRREHGGDELMAKIREAQLDALDSLIDRALILQEFKTKGYRLPEKFVDAEIEDAIANEYGGDRATFLRTLKEYNMTLAQYREKRREQLIVQLMRGQKAREYPIVSPYKIEKFYQDNIEQYKVGDQVKLRMIYIRKPQKPEQAADAVQQASATDTNTVEDAAQPTPVDPRRALADEIVARLDAGESFEKLARSYSEGKEASEGGERGWIGRDVLRRELNDVAFSLPAGQHSRVVETSEAYYILQVAEIKPAHVRPLGDVRDIIEKTLQQQQGERIQRDWIKSLRAKAYIRMF